MEDNILKTQEDNISWLLIKLEKWWNTIISKECWYSTLGKGDNQNCFKKKGKDENINGNCFTKK